MRVHLNFLSSAVVLGLILAGCATAKNSWEYRTRTTKERIGKSVLDQFGKSGWELVQFERIPVVRKDARQITTTNLEYQYIFKRPRP